MLTYMLTHTYIVGRSVNKIVNIGFFSWISKQRILKTYFIDLNISYLSFNDVHQWGWVVVKSCRKCTPYWFSVLTYMLTPFWWNSSFGLWIIVKVGCTLTLTISYSVAGINSWMCDVPVGEIYLAVDGE